MIDEELLQAILRDHPTPTAVVTVTGQIIYANDKALQVLALANTLGDTNTTIGDWRPPRANLLEVLSAVAVSSNWVPLKLQKGSKELHLRGRGIQTSAADEPYIVLVPVKDVVQPFRDHARQIQELNQQIGLHQQTEAELRKAMETSDLLKQELVHRVKNNLAVMSALLRSEARSSQDPAVQAVLQKVASRVMSISVVHEILDSSNHISEVELDRLITLILDRMKSSLWPPHISLETDLDAILADIELGLPLALLINELVTNAIKHAFEGRDQGSIKIDLRQKDSGLELRVSDDGIGISQKDNQLQKHPRIVQALAEQLDADIECHVCGGTHWVFRIRDAQAAQ